MDEIKFFWNGSIIGHHHTMIVNGKEIDLGNQDEARLEAVEILKRDYNIDYDINKIEFQWGGIL